jgi:hypothetical protein
MSFSLYATTFVDFSGVGSKVPAVFMNLVRTALPSAIDGIGGGTYSATAQIYVSGTHGIKADRFEIPNLGVLTVDAGGFINSEGTFQLGNTSVITGTGTTWNLDNGSEINLLGQLNITGGFLLVDAAATFTIGGTTNFALTSGVTVADAATWTSSGTHTLTGATVQSGTAAVHYNRNGLIPTGATATVDTSHDVWRLQDDPSNAQTITVAAPPASHDTPLHIYLSFGGTTNIASFFQPNGTTLIAVLGGTFRWTTPGSVSAKHASLTLQWENAISLWRIVSMTGACEPGTTAV